MPSTVFDFSALTAMEQLREKFLEGRRTSSDACLEISLTSLDKGLKLRSNQHCLALKESRKILPDWPEIFFRKIPFFGKRGGPKECGGLGSLWVCSSTGLAGGLTLDLERTQQQVGGRRRRRRVGPRRKPGARESSRRPSRQLRPPGLSQGQALLLDFTMI